MMKLVRLRQFLTQVKPFTILRIWKESRCLLKRHRILHRWYIQWLDYMWRTQQLVKWKLVSKFGKLSQYRIVQSWSRLMRLQLPIERSVTHVQTSKNLVTISSTRRILWWRNISQDFWLLSNFLKMRHVIWIRLWFFWSKLLKKVYFWIQTHSWVVR